MMFVVGFAIVAFAIFVPTIVIGGPIVAKVLFGYRGGLPYEWGIPGVAFALSRIEPSFKLVMTFWQKFGSWFEYAAVLAVLALVWKHKPRTTDETLHATEIMLLTVLALAPGFGVQYTGWLIAFLPFAFAWRGAIVMNAAISTFLFVTYTVWSGGWPWFFADIARPGRYRWVAAIAGYVMWAIVCAALVIAIRRFTAARRSETAG